MANYSFFLGQGGGSGGGSGGFAIIKIEYPAGSSIQVTFNGDTTDAPDTSGVWIYGCETTGTYTIKIKNTTTSTTVSITTKGQIETIWISQQVINYALIYYLKNEFAEPSDAEKRYAIKTSGWSVKAGTGSDQMINTNGYIQTPENCKPFWYTRSNFDYGTNRVNYGTGPVSYANQIISRTISSSDKGKKFVMGQYAFTENMPAWIRRDTSVGTTMTVYKEYDSSANHIFCTFAGAGNSLAIYACGYVKTDDLSGLSAYGSTINEILNNSVALFNDTAALNWMVLNCTGDFMVSALNDARFTAPMNTSPNKSILVANEHWNRFIALLSL